MKVKWLTGNHVPAACRTTSSAWLLGRLSGKLDCIESGANVEVFGLKKTSQPTAFICESHRQHLSQRLDETRIRLCDTWENVSTGVPNPNPDLSLPSGRWGYRAASFRPVGLCCPPEGKPWFCRDCSSPVEGSTSLGLR